MPDIKRQCADFTCLQEKEDHFKKVSTETPTVTLGKTQSYQMIS